MGSSDADALLSRAFPSGRYGQLASVEGEAEKVLPLHYCLPLADRRRMCCRALLVVLAIAAIAATVALTSDLICWHFILHAHFQSEYSFQPFGATATVEWPEEKDKFTILQIADTQVGEMGEPCENVLATAPCGVSNTTNFVRRLVERTDPDLVVFTGDQTEHSSDPEAALEAAWGPVRGAGVPFVFLFGNHDVQPTRATCSKWTYAEMHAYASMRALLTGTSMLTVFSSQGMEMFRLWFFDYVYNAGYAGYQPIPEAHVRWFKEQAARSITPGAAFLHVPLPEFSIQTNQTGEQNERVATSAENTGLYSAMRSSGSILSVSAGHDHVNDFCRTTDDDGSPTLCYAGGAGYTTYGKDGWSRRARVFEWHRDGPSDSRPGPFLSTHKLLDNEDLEVLDREWL